MWNSATAKCYKTRNFPTSAEICKSQILLNFPMMQNSATAKITVAKFWNRIIYCNKILRARNSAKSRSSHCCGSLQQKYSTKSVSLPLLHNSATAKFYETRSHTSDKEICNHEILRNVDFYHCYWFLQPRNSTKRRTLTYGKESKPKFYETRNVATVQKSATRNLVIVAKL